MTDPIEQILRKLKTNQEVMRTRFTASLLNNVGEILERDGFGAAKVYLLDRLERPELQAQARVLLNVVLPTLEASPSVQQRRSLGRYIVKTLIALQSQEV
ncbi:MAG: hypothetical protein H5T64_13160 [Chloroflexi bacterium]|nr:hypothetical protein [Chloroflexota bacterium]